MKKILRASFLIVCVTVILSACGTTGNGILFTERSIIPTDVKFQRVAILPNRLPLNLTDPEKWKKFNFSVMKKRFEREGFLVIDFNTSVEMFNKSGLPLEDTKVSRDKYAELAEEMDADILVFPYYGTSYRITGVTDKNNYEVVGSLQIYLGDQNDFMSRIDFEGNNYFSTYTKINSGFGFLVSALFMALGSMEDPPEFIMDPTFLTVVSLISPVASIAGLVPYLTPARKRWERAFTFSINKGLDQFFAKYQGRSTTPVAPKVTTPVKPTETTTPAVRKEEPAKPVPATPSSTPAREKPLSSMTLEELEKVKQQAVDAKDFRKAAAVKEEIDKRPK
jgi:hypothetical protein